VRHREGDGECQAVPIMLAISDRRSHAYSLYRIGVHLGSTANSFAF
jgi:hypothetical protein